MKLLVLFVLVLVALVFYAVVLRDYPGQAAPLPSKPQVEAVLYPAPQQGEDRLTRIKRQVNHYKHCR